MNENFSTPYWVEQVAQMEAQVGYGSLAHDFLTNPLIANNMVANDPHPDWGDSQLSEVERVFGKQGIQLLRNEPRFGGAPFRLFSTSTCDVEAPLNSIHHLYHLARFVDTTGVEIESQSILEWGGGFGNLARLSKGLFPGVSYSIVDLAFMTSIQRRYLDAVLGPEHGVTIHPVESLDGSTKLSADLFVSTWALSECTVDAHLYVLGGDFFGAKSVLIAHQKSSDLFGAAEDVESLCRNAGFDVVTEEFTFTGRGDQYVFGVR